MINFFDHVEIADSIVDFTAAGLRIVVIAATAPAMRVEPSMIDASSSLRPAWLNTAPL
jgi:hypothetical protein